MKFRNYFFASMLCTNKSCARLSWLKLKLRQIFKSKRKRRWTQQWRHQSVWCSLIWFLNREEPKKTRRHLKFKICRVKIIVKNVGKSNSWSTSPCLSKAEQSRIIRIRQRQWISIRVGCKWSKFRFRVHSCPRSDFDLNFLGIFMQFVCEYRTLHLNRST